MKVRQATVLDISSIVQMMVRHREEVEIAPCLGFDEELCAKGLQLAIGKDSSIILILMDGDTAIGYMWFNIVCPHFCEEYYASEQYLYVVPERRNGRAMLKLLSEARRASKLMGCQFLQVGVTSGVLSVERTYDKRFDRVGSIFNIYL